MTDLTPDVAEIERLLEAATPGPWEIIPQNGAGPMIAYPFDTGKQMNPKGLRLICHVLARRDSLKMDEANARLIAAAPAAIRSLLSRTRALEEALRSVRVFVQGSIEETHDRATLGNLNGARDVIDQALNGKDLS